MEKYCLNLALIWHCHLCAGDPGWGWGVGVGVGVGVGERRSELGSTAIDLAACIELVIIGKIIFI